MKINREFITSQNTYGGKNSPKYIVIHETDNWSNGAGAQRHASAQAAGHLSTSVHYYSGSDGVYQAASHTDGTYSVGKEYGGGHSVTDASNRNTINIEICVNSDGDYNAARFNAIELVKYLIQQTGIPASRVIRHYDAKGKYCPRKMMDNPALWEDFKKQIGQPAGATPEPEPVKPQEKEQWYRVGTGWSKGICQGQTGAYHNLNYAKAACKTGQRVYDENGTVVYSGSSGQQTAPEPVKPSNNNDTVKLGQAHANNFTNSSIAEDGIRGANTKKTGVKVLQRGLNMDYAAGLVEDGIYGSRTANALDNRTIRKGDKGCMVTALEILLMLKGYNPSGVENPGVFGDNLNTTLRQYQKDYGLTVDAIAGIKTFKSLVA